LEVVSACEDAQRAHFGEGGGEGWVEVRIYLVFTDVLADVEGFNVAVEVAKS